MTKPAPAQDAADVAGQPRWIEIFRAGTHTDMHGREMTFSDDWLRGVAERYKPELSEAAVVVGHPKTNTPAFAWVKALKFQAGETANTGTLLYAEHQTDADFAAARKAGRYKKRSASFFLPGSPNNPTPAEPYLRHVGFLGGAAPAVKGLKDADFSDHGEGVVEFQDEAISRWNWRTLSNLFSRIRDDIIERDGVERADRVIPRYDIESLLEAGLVPDRGSKASLYADDNAHIETVVDAPASTADLSDEDPAMTDQKNAEFAERETQLSAKDLELKERETKLREKEAKAARDAAGDFADGLVIAGKLLPAQKVPVVELLMFAASADANTATLSFADGDEKIEKPAEEVLRNFLDSLPQAMDYAEKSGQRGDGEHNISFAAPAGTAVDVKQLETHGKAKAYQQQHPNVSFVDAVKAVGG